MARLLEGRPQRTYGRLTKENLYKEAQVSRATMNRAHAVLAEWDAHLSAHGKTTPGEAQRDTTIVELKRRLANKTQECKLLSNKLKAAVTAIAALHHDNEALRQRAVLRPQSAPSGLAEGMTASDDRRPPQPGHAPHIAPLHRLTGAARSAHPLQESGAPCLQPVQGTDARQREQNPHTQIDRDQR